MIQAGDTLLGLRDPGPRVAATVTVPTVNAPAVTAAQRRVLHRDHADANAAHNLAFLGSAGVYGLRSLPKAKPCSKEQSFG